MTAWDMPHMKRNMFIVVDLSKLSGGKQSFSWQTQQREYLLGSMELMPLELKKSSQVQTAFSVYKL